MLSTNPTRLLFAAAVVGLFSGCSSSGGSQSLMLRESGLETNAEELRIRVRALARPFSGIMEEGADQVIETTDDPVVVRNSLEFKINAIPAMQTALFQRDPLAALYDAWAYIFQMRAYWESEYSGEMTPEEIAAGGKILDRMEKEILRIVNMTTSPEIVERERQLIATWAENNPMTMDFRSRPPTAGDLARFTANVKPGLRRTAASLTETLDDLTTRIDVYAAFLPKQARWQAELLLGDAVGTVGLDGVFGSVASMAESFDSIARSVDEVPGLLQEERELVLRAVQQERIAAIEALQKELLRAFEFISAERNAMVEEDLRNERIQTLEALKQERIAVMEVLRQERAATMAELEQLAADITENTLEGVIDHFILRAVQVGLVLIVVIALAAILVLRLGLRRKAS